MYIVVRKCRSVLYVDDDPQICVVVQTTLCLLAGMDVHTACSGEVAIDLAYEKRPDLIVLDLMMPGLDGPATYQRIRGSPLRIGDELNALWNKACATPALSDRPGAQAKVPDRVDALAESFLARTTGDVERLRVLVKCPRSDSRMELKEIERISHSIHGAGAMFGFPDVSTSGGAIEQLAVSLLLDPAVRAGSGEAALRLDQLTEQLSHALAAAHTTAPSKSAMFHGRAGGR